MRSHLSRTGLGLALALSLAWPGLPAQAQGPLPSLGDGHSMGTAAERRLGERIARELYRDPDYIEDAIIEDYVQGLWQPLLAAARARGELGEELEQRFAWEILIGRDRSINAFALPGGYLGLHLGLIGAVSTRDELASVLAHELTHVTQRHIARLMDQSSRITPWAIGAMVLGALAASRSPEAANAMIVGSQAAAVQSQLNFSRDMEREADRIGYGIAVQAGFDPAGFVSMFDKLQQASKLNDDGSFPYLRSHPLSTERMADMQARQTLRERPAASAATDFEHLLVAARARVLSNPGPDRLRAWIGEAQAVGADRPAAQAAPLLYAGTLAAARLRDGATTRSLLQRLRASVADDAAGLRQVLLLTAELSAAAGDPAAAQAALAAIPPARSTGRPELLLAAPLQIRAGQAAQAAQRLQTHVVDHPRDAAAWQLLARAYAEQGQTLRAIRAEAEQQVALLDYEGALDRLRAAQNHARQGRDRSPGDHIEASIIDTRTRAVEAIVKERQAERDAER